MNENILIVGNESIQTRGFVQALRGVGLAALGGHASRRMPHARALGPAAARSRRAES